jgi:hypothetical protein
MGISSDGLFFYGMCWADEDRPWKEPSDEELAKMKALKSYSDENDWETLYEVRSGKKSEKCPVELGIHCSFEYGMPLLAVKETLVNASRGSPEKAKTVLVKPEWDDQLREFCEIMGVKWQKPTWWVTSLYG